MLNEGGGYNGKNSGLGLNRKMNANDIKYRSNITQSRGSIVNL